MKIRLLISQRRTANSRGITLIECMVYIALVVIVLGLATAAFYRCFDNMKALRRNADDITTTLHAGELWRTDIRAATGPIKFDDSEQVLRVPRSDREVAYKFSEAQILRRANADAPWVAILHRVAKSQMQTDVHPQVTAWRWELELQALRQPATIRPLFHLYRRARHTSIAMKLLVSNPKRRPGERGFLVIALLALISLMLIYIAANLHVLAALKRDVRIVEQKQIRHWEKTFPPAIVSTNTAPVGLSPVEIAK